MKKKFKYKSELTGQIITFTVSEELSRRLQGKVVAPKKLAEANKFLREMKDPLPK